MTVSGLVIGGQHEKYIEADPFNPMEDCGMTTGTQPAKYSSDRFEQFQLQQENNIMVFVNEYISEDDVNKYGIEKTWLRYNAQYIGKSRPSGFQFQWTIDRERDVYLMMVSGPKRDDQQDYTICIFYWHGVQTVVNIRLAQGGSSNLNDTPFRMIWELVNIPDKDSTSTKERLEAFKEALAVYGYDGARRQIANTIVEFNF